MTDHAAEPTNAATNSTTAVASPTAAWLKSRSESPVLVDKARSKNQKHGNNWDWSSTPPREEDWGIPIIN